MEPGEEGFEVSVIHLSGESSSAYIKTGADGQVPEVSVSSLQGAIAAKLGGDVSDFQLLDADCSRVLEGDTSVHTLQEAGEEEKRVATVYIIKHKTLLRHEEEGKREWRKVAAGLQNAEIDDDAMLRCLCDFLDKFPALVNWQNSATEGSAEKPLLLFATESMASRELRQHCVDELLRRGARVKIRHSRGYLLTILRSCAGGCAFLEYLEEKESEYEKYEREAVKAWRDVSSKLCAETRSPAKDEAEMATVMNDFCAKFPEMVNFQSNHAVDEKEEPYGLFGYASLMSFAGGRSTSKKDVAEGRRTSVMLLLAHGARVDMQHAGQTSMVWMQQRGSLIVNWLQEQLKKPLPAQQAFNFNFERAA